ncbi:MAG: helix-turn-helix transcriptional regulator [Clostridia bacterium]|nr:helix-turn-helix transcriptional regulator [Clostridia bacterium]
MEIPDNIYILVGKRVRQLRLQKKLTQEELAERAGISTSFLGHIERGSRRMSLDSFCRIARALDCTANDLLPMESGNARISALELLRCAAMLAEAEDVSGTSIPEM